MPNNNPAGQNQYTKNRDRNRQQKPPDQGAGTDSERDSGAEGDAAHGAGSDPDTERGDVGRDGQEI